MDLYGHSSTMARLMTDFGFDALSKVEKGWQTNSGFVNDNQQRVQDSHYYQNLLLMIVKKRKLKFTPISWKTEDEESNVQLVSQSLKVLKIVLLFFFKNDYFKYLEKINTYNEKPTSKIFNFNRQRKVNWKFRL